MGKCPNCGRTTRDKEVFRNDCGEPLFDSGGPRSSGPGGVGEDLRGPYAAGRQVKVVGANNNLEVDYLTQNTSFE